MDAFDVVLMIVCGALFLLLTALLVWWLKVGKRHFIAKRCPERLEKKEDVESEGDDLHKEMRNVSDK